MKVFKLLSVITAVLFLSTSCMEKKTEAPAAAPVVEAAPEMAPAAEVAPAEEGTAAHEEGEEEGDSAEM